jgi:hypothetical protein
MMQKSTTFTTIFRVKNVPLSLRYAKNAIFQMIWTNGKSVFLDGGRKTVFPLKSVI